MELKFEKFMAAVAWQYCTDETYQDVVNASGIDFKSVPPCVGKEVVGLYREARLKFDHHTAKFQINDQMRICHNFADDLKVAPYDAIALRGRFNELMATERYYQLSMELEKSPERGKEILETFQLTEAKSITSARASDFGVFYLRQHLAKINQGESPIVKIKLFEKLSEMIGGFNGQRIGIITGETGFGKTNFCLNLAIRAAFDMRVAYVNMEMSLEDMTKRLAVILGQVSYSDFQKGNFNQEVIERRLCQIGDKIEMTSGQVLTLEQIESWLKLENSKKKISIVFIDYDQKLELKISRETPEWKAIQNAILSLEEVAKKLDLFILVAAQVNRDGQISGSHRSIFPAHVHLNFRNDEIYGPLIEAKKNRHGKKNQALTVTYDESNSSIQEKEILTTSNEKPKKTLTPTPRGA